MENSLTNGNKVTDFEKKFTAANIALPKCRRQNILQLLPAGRQVILFNFITAAERQKFSFRHFGNALTLGASKELYSMIKS